MSSSKRDQAGASTRGRGQRGVASIELALCLVVLLPLVLGVIDFGYYFYVSVTAAEAARVASRTASTSAVGACTNTSAATAAANAAQSAATGYMTRAGLTSSVVTTTPTALCQTVGGLTPVWNVAVKVDFSPLIGFARTWMKPSTLGGCTGCVTFTQTVFVLGS